MITPTTLTLTDSKIMTEMVVKCLVGKGLTGTSYASWSKDLTHRKQAKTRNIFESIWPENGGPLPWRLTKVQRDLLDNRMSCIVWPHYIERLFYKGFIYYFVRVSFDSLHFLLPHTHTH